MCVVLAVRFGLPTHSWLSLCRFACPQVYEACPQLSGLVLLALASAGRGGEGDMGQRIRDEILAIQQRNHCKVSRQLHGIRALKDARTGGTAATG